MVDNPTNLFNENRYWSRSRVNAVLVTIPAAQIAGLPAVAIPITDAMIQGNAPLNGICRQIVIDASRTGVTYAAGATPGTFQVSCQISDAIGPTEYPLFDVVGNIDFSAHAAIILNVMQGSNSGTAANAGIVLGTNLSVAGQGGADIKTGTIDVSEVTPWAGAIYADTTIHLTPGTGGDAFDASGDLRILFVME